MKTTEIFVEQALIGFLVLAVIVLIGIEHPWQAWRDAGLDASATAALGVALVGIAYFLGILYDRLADTLFEGFDRHNRLAMLLEGKGSEEAPDKREFPEGKMRLATMREGGAVNEHASYLRRRLRLARALATLTPALTVAWISRQSGGRAAVQSTEVWLAVAYATGYFWELAGLPYWPPLPEDSDKLAKYRSGFHSKHGVKWWRMLAADGACWAGVAVFAWALYLNPQHWLVTGAGGLTTLVAGSVWWRISITHRRFLHRVWNSAEQRKEKG